MPVAPPGVPVIAASVAALIGLRRDEPRLDHHRRAVRGHRRDQVARPVAVGGSPPSERPSSVIRLIAPALLAALIVYEALSADGHGPQFDARLVGVGVAAVGLLARLPLLVIVARRRWRRHWRALSHNARVVERDVAVATVRAFAERSGAERVVLLLDEGPGAPTLIELTAAGLEIVADGLRRPGARAGGARGAPRDPPAARLGALARPRAGRARGPDRHGRAPGRGRPGARARRRRAQRRHRRLPHARPRAAADDRRPRGRAGAAGDRRPPVPPPEGGG